MKRESREFARTAAIGLSVMVGLPLSYRIWRHFNPEPERSQQTMSDFFAQAVKDRAVVLLQTPLSKWSRHDKESEPRIYAWLEARTAQVLPWEWTDEARRKDPDGYRRLWRGLLKEQWEELNRRLEVEEKTLKSLERELWVAEKLQEHRSNGVVRVLSGVVTNSFRLTLDVEDLVAKMTSVRARVAAINELILRTETILGRDEIDDMLCISEICRYLNNMEIQ